MQEIIITKNESGFRLKKLCMKYLDKAPASFIYKMLRKKNIVLNDKKADGNEVLAIGDSVKFYLRDETISEFQSGISISPKTTAKLDILYEDSDYIFCYKPENVLSQKASPDDISINEMILDYLLQKNDISSESIRTFKPSVVNRLDRNTSGIILAGKSPEGTRYLSKIIKNRDIDKYYMAVVSGKCNLSGKYTAYLSKDERTNTVKISEKHGDSFIETGFELINYNPALNTSVLKIELITGKSHQIRAHLASLGFPIIGDIKYGNKDINSRFKKEFNINSQLLTAYMVHFPDSKEEIAKSIQGKNFELSSDHLRDFQVFLVN